MIHPSSKLKMEQLPELSAPVRHSADFFNHVFDGAEIPQNVLNPVVAHTLAELDARRLQHQVEVTFDLARGSCEFRLNQDVVVPVFEQGHAWQTYAVRPRRWGEDLPSLAYTARLTIEGRAPQGVA
jgi:hypothetical protein